MLTGSKKHLTAIIVPTDYCNMNCVYCFNDRRTCAEKNIMSEDTLRRTFQTIIPYYSSIRFIWHGGEPLSLGREFFENVLRLQKEINTHNAVIINSIQSNLTLLNRDLAVFLIENGFLINGSYDGTQNEATRHCSSQIIQGYETVKECGGDCSFICVVQSRNIDHLIEDFLWFNEKRINYTLNIYLSGLSPHEDELYVPADYYARKICELFDFWMHCSDCRIHVTYFEMFADYFFTKRKALCKYNSCIGKYVSILSDGRIFCCNRSFPDDYCFGNVRDYGDIRDCFKSEGFERLLTEAIARRNTCSETCDIFQFCAGGCNSSACTSGKISEPNRFECDVLRSVYYHIKEQLDSLKASSLTGQRDLPLNPFLTGYLSDNTSASTEGE